MCDTITHWVVRKIEFEITVCIEKGEHFFVSHGKLKL